MSIIIIIIIIICFLLVCRSVFWRPELIINLLQTGYLWTSLTMMDWNLTAYQEKVCLLIFKLQTHTHAHTQHTTHTHTHTRTRTHTLYPLFSFLYFSSVPYILNNIVCQHGQKNIIEFGFDGKSLIHPNQVETSNKIYSPTKDEIHMAKRIVSSYHQARSGLS